MKRVGISTGGGDCPGLNAVLRAFVKAGRRQFGFEVLGIVDGLDGLIGAPRVVPLEYADVQGILPRGGTILGTTSRGNPFRYARPDAQGRLVEQDVSAEVVANARQLGLEGLVMVGGDGTLDIGRQLMERGLPVIGVPKTIDNDLSATDFTFGFDTALGVAMEALDRLNTTAASHNRVMLLEVMGRHAGWIALHAGIAGGCDFIAIPEIPYDVATIAEGIRHRQRAGSPFAVGVVAEGAHPSGGEASYLGPVVAGANPRLSGAAQRLEAELDKVGLTLEKRVTVLGHLQRGGTPSAFDRILASRFGVAAAELVGRGEWGRMVCLRTPEVVSVPLLDALKTHRVDPEGQLVRHAEALGICLGR